jgi:signal transduction histidine kinase
MQATPSPSPLGTLAVVCRRCGAEASVRAGKEYLCPRCAAAAAETPGSPDTPFIVCDLCDRESLVRLGERFLCARCALGVLFRDDDDIDAIGTLARAGVIPLTDLASAHHQALARSMKRAHDRSESVQRVEAGAVLFNLWASSFDARREELERANGMLARMTGELERQVDELTAERDEMRVAIRRSELDRRRVARRLIEAREEERRRIALDLHDEAIQALEAAFVRLESIRTVEADAGQRTALEELVATTKRCIDRLRRVTFELGSDLPERHGLVEALRQFLDRTAEQFDLLVGFDDRLVDEPEPFVRINLYRIVQEALANVRKHAKARRVDVTIEERERGILVTVRDDGVGFSPATLFPSADRLGLDVMRGRAEASGGWFRVDSVPGIGTSVTSWVPGPVPENVERLPGPAP